MSIYLSSYTHIMILKNAQTKFESDARVFVLTTPKIPIHPTWVVIKSSIYLAWLAGISPQLRSVPHRPCHWIPCDKKSNIRYPLPQETLLYLCRIASVLSLFQKTLLRTTGSTSGHKRSGSERMRPKTSAAQVEWICWETGGSGGSRWGFKGWLDVCKMCCYHGNSIFKMVTRHHNASTINLERWHQGTGGQVGGKGDLWTQVNTSRSYVTLCTTECKTRL